MTRISYKLVSLVIVTLLLSGCQSLITSCPPPTPIPAEVQRAAADELDPNSAIAQVLAAALNDRDKLRACRLNS